MAYFCNPGNELLREALDAPDGLFISSHREYIESLRSVLSHTVVFRELLTEGTCVVYALRLGDERTYWAVADNFERKIFAGKGFMEWLVKGHLVEMNEPKDGCLVLYFNEDVWQHVGVVFASGRVISQWGEFPVYEHAVCEVPMRYGDEVRYFEKPQRERSLRLFMEYAKARGVSDADLLKAMRK